MIAVLVVIIYLVFNKYSVSMIPSNSGKSVGSNSVKRDYVNIVNKIY